MHLGPRMRTLWRARSMTDLSTSNAAKAPVLSQVIRINISDIIPYARNPRTHSDAQIAQIAASIREFGWTNPILVDENKTLIAGHGRLLAARQLDITEVPAITLGHLSEAQKRALVIADNKLALNAGWDPDLLKVELEDIGDIELDAIGFTQAEFDQLFAGDGDLADEWQGMPEFEQDDVGAFQSVAVHFRDQEGVDEFARLIAQKITDRTKFVWFPFEIEESYIDKRYVSEP